MKKILLGAVALCFATLLSAQQLPIDEGTGKATYMKVMEIGDVTAVEAKTVIKKWAANQATFSTTTDEASKTFYKGRYKVNYPAPKGGISHAGNVSYTLQFFYKDGKFRYILTDLIHSGKYGSGGDLENKEPKDGYGKITERAWNMITQQTIEQAEKMVEEFTKAITEFQNDPARSDDW